jgi:hypothetical protein
MKLYSIYSNGAKLASFELPESLHEVTLRQFIDDQVEFLKTPQWFQDFRNDGGKISKNQTANFISCSIKLLSKFTGVGIEVFKDSDDVNGLIKIWNELNRTLKTYEPKFIASFEYKGETFIVPTMQINHYTGQKENPNLSNIEVITSLQYEFLLNDTELIKAGRNYEKHLAIVAILCRKEGENLEMTDDEIIAFTSKRMKFFKDLPASIALDVMFFFINSSTTSKKMNFAALLLRVLSAK